MDRPVVDQTGLKGRYDFILKWDARRVACRGGPKCTTRPLHRYQGTARIEARSGQGFRARSRSSDHIDKPSPN